MENRTLYHHGVKGQKWGKRLYQYKNGTLTPLGRLRYLKNKKDSDGDSDSKTAKTGSTKSTSTKSEPAKSEQVKTDTAYSTARKSVKDMSDTELAAAINRLRNEQTYNQLYNQLNPPKVSKGKEFLTTMWDRAITPALSEAGKKVMSEFITDRAEKALGLKKGEAKDALSELRKEFDTLKLKKDIENLKNPKSDPYEELKKQAEIAKLEKQVATDKQKTQQVEDWWKKRADDEKKESVDNWNESNKKEWDAARKRAEDKGQESAKKERERVEKVFAERDKKQQDKETKRDAKSAKETERILKDLDKAADAARQQAEKYKSNKSNDIIDASPYEVIVSKPTREAGKYFIDEIIDAMH